MNKTNLIAKLLVLVSLGASSIALSQYYPEHRNEMGWPEMNRDGEWRDAFSELDIQGLINQVNALAAHANGKVINFRQLEQARANLNVARQQLANVQAMIGIRPEEARRFPGDVCAILYQEKDFKGPSYEVITTDGDFSRQWLYSRFSSFPINARTGGFDRADVNDKLSSVMVGRGCTIELWQDASFGGFVHTYRDNAPVFFQGGDKQYSSAKCSCAR